MDYRLTVGGFQCDALTRLLPECSAAMTVAGTGGGGPDSFHGRV